MPPGPGPTWAALPQELVQQAAGLLGDGDRWVGKGGGGLQAQRGGLGGLLLPPRLAGHEAATASRRKHLSQVECFTTTLCDQNYDVCS